MRLSSTSTLFSLLVTEIYANGSTDPCSGHSSGLVRASKGCTTAFYICVDGKATALLNCPGGSFFNEETEGCHYKEVACVDGWNGQDPLQQLPILIRQFQIKGINQDGQKRPNDTTIVFIILSIFTKVLVIIYFIVLYRQEIPIRKRNQYQTTNKEADINLWRKEGIYDV